MKPYYFPIQKTILINALATFLFVLANLNLYSQSTSGLNFDGIDDRCTINDHASYNLGTGNFTIEAWIKANTSQTTYPTILSNRETGNVNSGLLFFLINGKITLQMDGINLPSAGNSLKDNICHHIAVTRTGTAINYYVDGVLASTLTGYGQNIDAAHAFWIGRDDPSSSNTMFKGWIHELRFWNVARTATQIANSDNIFLLGNETGLIGYWQMNEGSGQIINDLSPINNDGFLGTVNTADAADPIFFTGSCLCVAATVTPQGPTTFCTGGSVTLAASAGAGYIYQWQLNSVNISGATSANYVASASGNYRVVVTANGCTATSANIAVTVLSPLTPTITSSGFGGFCPSTTVGIETQFGAGYSYQWFEDTYAIPLYNSYQLLTGHNGNYKVNVTNACGTYASGFYTVTDFNQNPPWGPTPYITIINSGSLTICSGGSVQLYDNSGTFFFQPTYQWYKDGVPIGGAVGSSYNATAGGNYVLSVSDYFVWCGQGPTVFSNFLTVTVGAGTQPTVVISAGGATTFCNGGSVTLNSTVNTGVTYQWKKNGVNISGATSASYLANTTGTFTCVVTNACASVTSNSIVVTVQTLTANATSPSLNICTGSTTTLSVNAQSGNTYQWKLNGNNIAGATNATYAASVAGSYTCTITNLCGSATSNTLVMTLRPKPTAVISGSQTICPGGTATLSIAFTGTPNWVGYYYNGTSHTYFSTALNPYTFNVTLAATRTYTLYSPIFNDAYCSGTVSGSATVTVSATPVATISAGGATTFCSGSSVLLNANAGTGLTYQWIKSGVNISGATSASYAATTTGTYTVQVTSSCGTATSSGTSVTVNALPSATITAGGPTTFCSGGSVTLNAPVAANRTYQWKKGGVNIAGATNSSYTAIAGGTYKVTVTNTSTGCSKTTATGTTVTVNAKPSATITPQGPTTFCAGQSVVLAANTGAGLTYKWKKNGGYISGAIAANYTATTAGNYRVEVTNSNGCSKQSSAVTVTVPCRGDGAQIISENFNMTVFPNPSQGDFKIEIDNYAALPATVELSDITGRIVDSFIMHDVHHDYKNTGISKGIYFIRVNGKNKYESVRKVIID